MIIDRRNQGKSFLTKAETLTWLSFIHWSLYISEYSLSASGDLADLQHPGSGINANK